MLAGATQRHRVAELITPLGPDKLLLTAFTAHEELSQPFEIRIDAVSEDHDIDFNAVIGRNCSIRFRTPVDKKRYFVGVLVEAGWSGARQDGNQYELVLRPWLWLLTQASDNRIFQNQTVVEIIQKVFKDAGFEDFEINLKQSYPKIEYCVQYRESNFQFVSRLMERYGIYYFFRHEPTKHVLVLADEKGSHAAVPELPRCRFLTAGETLRDPEQTLSSWHVARVFRTGRVTVNAFDFVKPMANMFHEQSQKGGYQHDTLEHYDHVEKYKQGQESDLGKKLAQAMLHSRQGQDRRRTAEGDAPSLFAGGLVTVFGDLPQAEQKEYLVVSASHAFAGEAYRSGEGGGEGNSYQGQYLLQPSDRPFKAPVVTPRPLMSGPQTATVVGPKGEEIHTDAHGRVKVHFHWDRNGKRDQQSSRWVRVAQMHAGKGWGGQFLPRIGMEVVVDFLEGDPDKPLIVGTVYNGVNPPPYKQPDNLTQSGIKTRSSKGGGESDYNELMFEDKKNEEFVRFHAQKDFKVTVEDKETRIIQGKNKNDKGAKGAAPKDPTPEEKATAREITIEKGDDVLHVKTGNQKAHVGNDYLLKVDKQVMITAAESITLHCGDSTIVMKPMTIEIKTPSLTIDTTKTKIEGKTLIEQKSAMIKLN